MSKRYKYGLFIIMIIVLNTTNTESHDEFMKYVNCVYQDVINPSNCGHVIRWENWENIPIETRFSFDFPLDLNGSQAEIEFPDLLDNWPGVSFEQKSSGNDNIVVRFTTDASYFSGLHVYGRAIHCIKNGFIVAYDDSPDCTQSNSWVLLNNSANITFQWTQNPYQVGTWVNFNGVIVHEIGHVLGLGHCT
ncbi:MAG: matrixin family metalloprotease, partial [Bacteroidota bacterium]